MILVDTSVWADHFREAMPPLTQLLTNHAVAIHPFVVGELAMGNLRDRQRMITALGALTPAPLIDDENWLAFVEQEDLAGSGLGFVDAHLLASAAAGDLQLWTRDRRLADRAQMLGRRWNA